MLAYHFLRANMQAGEGHEPAWTEGEERTWEGTGKPVLCQSGYHSSPSWYDALQYAPGPVACLVQVSEPVANDDSKQVSYSRKLLAARNVERELRLWTCDCAERALNREREHGRETDPRCRKVIEVLRLYADDAASLAELAAAGAAARAAAWAAARDAARDAAWAAAWAAARTAAGAASWDVAWDAAVAAAWAAVWDAAGAAEVAWQRERLDAMLDGLFVGAISAAREAPQL